MAPWLSIRPPRSLPPMRPGFDSWSRCHMWVELVVDSRLPAPRVFHRAHFQIPIRPGNSGEKSHPVDSTEIPLLLFIIIYIVWVL